eukprot:300803-Hanusia_phi.AAC.1
MMTHPIVRSIGMCRGDNRTWWGIPAAYPLGGLQRGHEGLSGLRSMRNVHGRSEEKREVAIVVDTQA